MKAWFIDWAIRQRWLVAQVVDSVFGRYGDIGGRVNQVHAVAMAAAKARP